MSYEKQLEFAKKLQHIDDESGILNYLGYENDSGSNSSDHESTSSLEFDNLYPLTIMAKAKEFASANTITEENVNNMSQLFVDSLKFTTEEIEAVKQATIGQHTNDYWHEMRHLLVTAKKVKSLYTRQKLSNSILEKMSQKLLTIFNQPQK